MIIVVHWGCSGGAAEVTKFAYSLSPSSPCGSGAYGETTVTDPNGHNTIYCYDGTGRVTPWRRSRSA